MRERASDLHFTSQAVVLKQPLLEPLLGFQPIAATQECILIGLTESGRLLRWNLSAGATEDLGALPPSHLDLCAEVSLTLSAEGKFAAIVNTMGQHGMVLNLETGATTMPLDRSDYHNDVCVFPVAFFTQQGRTLLVHGTDWNRLDISDPATGECLTVRESPSYQEGEARPPHYLDYFHCGLSISPDQRWVVDNGWVWHPVGVLNVWRLDTWLEENVWESEDGTSLKALYDWDYWDGPLCWIDDKTLAVGAWSGDYDHRVPTAHVFDVETGEELRWFAGPVGQVKLDHAPRFRKNTDPYPSLLRPQDMFVFDVYLFSFSEEQGISVFDVETGERLLHDPTFCPLRYHPRSQQFISLTPEGAFGLHTLRQV